MAVLPTPEEILNGSKLPPCLGIDIKPMVGNLSVFDIGLKPLILGTINAILGPIGIILDALPKFPNPKKFLTPILDLSLNLQGLIVELLNLKLTNFPSIEIPLFGVTLGTGPKLDPLQIKFLVNFIVGLIKIPLEIFTGIIGKLLSLDLSFDIPGLIKAAMAGFEGLFNIQLATIPFDLTGNFIKCVTTVITNAFGPLSNGAALNSAKASQEETQKEQAKLASTKYSEGDSAGAISIIEEYQIKPEDYKKHTGVDSFYTLVSYENPQTDDQKYLKKVQLV